MWPIKWLHTPQKVLSCTPDCISQISLVYYFWQVLSLSWPLFHLLTLSMESGQSNAARHHWPFHPRKTTRPLEGKKNLAEVMGAEEIQGAPEEQLKLNTSSLIPVTPGRPCMGESLVSAEGWRLLLRLWSWSCML